jgi:hypothetical protein
MDRHLFDKWLRVAEEKARPPKLEGGLWHPYCRKRATERKHPSVRDVAAAGGWNDADTLIECYTGRQIDPGAPPHSPWLAATRLRAVVVPLLLFPLTNRHTPGRGFS